MTGTAKSPTKPPISREATPEEEERSLVAQKEILDVFIKHELTYEEGLSVLTWLIAKVMYKSCSWPANEWGPALAVRLEAALREIERHEQQGKVPLA